MSLVEQYPGVTLPSINLGNGLHVRPATKLMTQIHHSECYEIQDKEISSHEYTIH